MKLKNLQNYLNRIWKKMSAIQRRNCLDKIDAEIEQLEFLAERERSLFDTPKGGIL